MKIKLKLQQKIRLFIITASIIIYVIAVGYISFSARKMAYNDAIEKTNILANEAAKDMKALLDANMSVVISLSDAFRVYKNYPIDEWHKLIHDMYIEIFTRNKNIYGLWDSWELAMIDSTWEKSYGRISHSYWRDNGVIKDIQEYKSLDGDSELYLKFKTTLIKSISEPYFDAVTDSKTESLLMTSLNSPLVVNGKFVALVSFDITLLQLQQIIEKIKPFEGSYAFLTSNKGMISGHPNSEYLNKSIGEIFEKDNQSYHLLDNIEQGETFNYISENELGVKTYFTFSPINIVSTDTPWSIAIAVPINTIMATANRNFRISLLVGIIGILILAALIAIISKNITNPLTKITELLNRLAKGHIDDNMKIKIETGDEIEEMTHALNHSIDSLNKKVNFANEIGKGEFNTKFDLLSDDDVLGKSLIEMRGSLTIAENDNEKRKLEDEKRRWSNEGIAKFSDILRSNNDSLEKLATDIIVSLVNYLKADQGGIFILSDDTKKIHYNLLSAFAYDRKKYVKRHIKLGEGLIGMCAIEKKTIYMTDIPEDYIEITSGLGDASPNSLLIVPMKLEDQVLGVLEITSFHKFETHEIEFIEKLGENIASTMLSTRMNIRTSELLEQSQQQAEEMSAQEEEMRQNMEELQATQEESTRKSAEMEGIVEALNMSSYVVEYNLEGYIKKVNDNYLNLLQMTREEVIETHHSGNVEFTDEQKKKYDIFWHELISGKMMKETSKIKVNDKEFLFSETYTPIKNADGETYKILKIANNIGDFSKDV